MMNSRWNNISSLFLMPFFCAALFRISNEFSFNCMIFSKTNRNWKFSFQDYSLPGVDQVMMIRIFIKYLHHFMNEAAPNSKNEIPPLSTSISQKDELKRYDTYILI